MLKRRDYTMVDLFPGFLPKQMDMLRECDLFSDLGDKVFIPKEKKSFPPVHFMKLHEIHEQ